jgi:hypothetical protein
VTAASLLGARSRFKRSAGFFSPAVFAVFTEASRSFGATDGSEAKRNVTKSIVIGYPDQPVIPKTEQPDSRAHAPRTARKWGVLARDEESRRRNGGTLASFETLR